MISHYAPLSWFLLALAAIMILVWIVAAVIRLRPAPPPMSPEQRRREAVTRETTELLEAMTDLARRTLRDPRISTAGDLVAALRANPSFDLVRPWLSRQVIEFFYLCHQASHAGRPADRLRGMLDAEITRLETWALDLATGDQAGVRP